MAKKEVDRRAFPGYESNMSKNLNLRLSLNALLLLAGAAVEV
jgi:hypothetical protein